MGALETLHAKYQCQLLFVESGGDNLAANYSRELADYIIYVIDVSVCGSAYHLSNSTYADLGWRQDPKERWPRYLAV